MFGKYKVLHIIVIAALISVAILAFTVVPAQKKVYDERVIEKENLKQEEKEVILENDRLNKLSQYIDTEEYYLFYAMYRLHYCLPDQVIYSK